MSERQHVQIISYHSISVPLTIVSISVSLLSLFHTGWKLQRLDHRLKGLPIPPSSEDGNTWLATVTFVLWQVTSIFGQLASLVLLGLVTYVEMLSGHLHADGTSLEWAVLLPWVVLATGPVINLIARSKLVEEGGGSPYGVGQGILSSVFPMR